MPGPPDPRVPHPRVPHPRALPGQPNLRYLKLEAKRRLAAGEFPTLHDAQTAIAREHGLPTWAALKQRIDHQHDSHALDQLRWVISRFRGAADPDWPEPPEDELRRHFNEPFLSVLPPPTLIAAISKLAKDLDGEPVVLGQTPVQAYVELKGMHYIAVVEPEPPHRLTALRGLPAGSRVHDPRTAEPPVRTQGQVPAGVPDIAEQAVAELGLTALLLAGGDPQGDPRSGQGWILTQGWADLDRAEPLDPAHQFPAPGATALVTTTAVLRLAAEHAIDLDHPANDYLKHISLADATVTVRDLLSHTSGVDDPTKLYADAVPDLAELLGPVVACTGPRGTVNPSNGGVAVLGQLLADVTEMPYAAAAKRLILDPLRLKDSNFPARATDLGPRAVTGYQLTPDGTFQAIPAQVPVLQAVAGLWSTGADLVRLGLGWSTLLPEALAHEALTPQTSPGPGGARVGLGWIISPRGDMATHAGGGFEGTAAITTRIRDQRTHVVLISRLIPVNSIENRLLQAWTNPT